MKFIVSFFTKHYIQQNRTYSTFFIIHVDKISIKQTTSKFFKKITKNKFIAMHHIFCSYNCTSIDLKKELQELMKSFLKFSQDFIQFHYKIAYYQLKDLPFRYITGAKHENMELLLVKEQISLTC